MRRKNVVVAFFDTIQNDVVREIDSSVHTEPFQKRLAPQSLHVVPLAPEILNIGPQSQHARAHMRCPEVS
jgi:hypothetical protein